jgi:Zn-dependent protease with chaperone function
MRSLGAQALAMPASRTVLITERTLQILSDNEIAVICAHELAHLTEAKTEYFKRYVQWLIFLPWLLVKPVVHACGPLGLAILLLASAAVPKLYRRISRKLELRADERAKAEERDEGTYAQALARLYEDNLLPAVTAKNGTHPHLYDRLIAAGLTPDFPRPTPASSMTWYGHLLAGLMGVLAAMLVGNYLKP